MWSHRIWDSHWNIHQVKYVRHKLERLFKNTNNYRSSQNISQNVYIVFHKATTFYINSWVLASSGVTKYYVRELKLTKLVLTCSMVSSQRIETNNTVWAVSMKRNILQSIKLIDQSALSDTGVLNKQTWLD